MTRQQVPARLALSILLAFIPCAYKNVVRMAGAQVEQEFGGENTTRGEFPWFTAVQNIDGSLRCSGCLIGSYFVLTASHCVENAKDTELEIGYWCREKGNCGRKSDKIGVREVWRHESEGGRSGGDLVLLGLNRAVNIPVKPAVPYLGPSALPKQRSLNRGRKMMMVGAGQDGTGNEPSAFVKKLEVEYLAPKKCKKRLSDPSKVTDTTICSTAVNQNGRPCGGDSGAALVVDGKGKWKGRDIILAVHNLGPRVCTHSPDDQPFLHFRMQDAADLLQAVVCGGDFPEDWCGGATKRTGCDLSVTVACTVSDEVVNDGHATNNNCDSVHALPSSALICGDRPTRVTLRYNGGSCSQSDSRQSDSSCSNIDGGPPTTAPARIVVRGGKSGSLYFDDVVNSGAIFDLEANGDEMDSKVEIQISIHSVAVQDVRFRVSCAGDGLNLFEKFGSIDFVGFTNGESMGHVLGVVEAEYTIAIQNGGITAVKDVALTINGEASNQIGEGESIEPSGNRLLTSKFFIERANPATYSMAVLVLGRSTPDDTTCEASETLKFSVDAASCSERIQNSLVVKYIGGGCRQSTKRKGTSSSCIGRVVTGDALLVVSDESGGPWLITQIAIGETFTLPRGERRSVMTVVIRSGEDQIIVINTSCTRTIHVGDKFGALEVTGI